MAVSPQSENPPASVGDFSQPVTNREAAGFQPVPELQVRDRDLSVIVEIDTERLMKRYKYRLVHKSRLKFSRAKSNGYVIVNPEEEVIYSAVTGEPIEPAEDGTYTLGDTVLMKILLDRYRQRRKAKKVKTDERLRGPKRRFKAKARGLRDRAGNEIEVITNLDPQEPSTNQRRRRK